ncbi:amino acid ABC transporter substrate-binding protein, PAAT family [Variovorax sp. CF079]|uniref:amino acid ABC transporter substrate-binding protein n=1 Tax=Variovorax sp. CF079 TaxID=1882774 RepID=UPI00088E0E38|nr:amino acid ABC transporter substrate-binding protein [Variovorax sp. CF079]SDE93642.1 amino acid ABC transporter substrate-binding protein, PAAT family [Variovorax sp. CF079]
MKAKFLSALLACTACAAASGQGFTGTLAKVAETKSITIGHRESGIPLSYVDDKQKPIGYAIDLCVQVAEAVKQELKLPKLDVKFAEVNGSTRIPLIANGTIDLECGTTTNNVERQKQVAFSSTTFIAAARFASKRADNLNDVNDLKGRTVTANAGSNNLELANSLNASRKLQMNIMPAKDFAEGFLMLETGRANAMILDDILLAGVVANSKDPSKYVISAQALSAEPYAIMIRRDDPAFKKLVDNSLKTIYASGAAAKLYQKWFQSPIPPRNINLNLPPSKALLRVWQTPIDAADPAAYTVE